jgi:hypothetical protein
LSNVAYLDETFQGIAAAKVNAANVFTGVNDFQGGFVASTLTTTGMYAYGTITSEGKMQINADLQLGYSTVAGNIQVSRNMLCNNVIRCSPYNGLGWDIVSSSEIVNCSADPCMTYEIYLQYTSVTGRAQQVNLPSGTIGQKIVIIQRNTAAGTGGNALIQSADAGTVFINKLVGTYPLVITPQHCATLMFLGPMNLLGTVYANAWQVLTYI